MSDFLSSYPAHVRGEVTETFGLQYRSFVFLFPQVFVLDPERFLIRIIDEHIAVNETALRIYLVSSCIDEPRSQQTYQPLNTHPILMHMLAGSLPLIHILGQVLGV